MPDSSIMLELCELLKINVNELLSGERIMAEAYNNQSEQNLLEMRKERETSISYGIGHGGFEVILILGITYIQYISYCIMINTGTFQTVVDQVTAQAPNQLSEITALVTTLSTFSFADLGIAVVERIFAVLFHIGASIFVFYACRDRKRFWLYPSAILLHTAMDFIRKFPANR